FFISPLYPEPLLIPDFFNTTMLTSFSSFFFYCSGHHRDLHSFPTRRSSDLLFLAAYFGSSPFRDFILGADLRLVAAIEAWRWGGDRKSTRLNSSHRTISYAVFCLKKKKKKHRKYKPSNAINDTISQHSHAVC